MHVRVCAAYIVCGSKRSGIVSIYMNLSMIEACWICLAANVTVPVTWTSNARPYIFVTSL